MSESEQDATAMRWPRGQRFQLSPHGREAGALYRAAIVASRDQGGRRSFDAARNDWAAQHALDPGDGLYLGELQAGPRTLDELAAALEECGPQRKEVRAAIERLVKQRLVELVAPPPRPPPPPRRW